jgi:transposase
MLGGRKTERETAREEPAAVEQERKPAESVGSADMPKVAQEIDSPPKRKHKPYKRKFNTQKVQALAKRGMIATDIAKSQGVSLSTITRYLAEVDIKAKDIQRYKSDRADRLALNQLKAATIADMIVDKWIQEPEILTSQDVRTQKEVLIAVNSVKTYDHNSERLERDLSTSNTISIVADIETLRALRKAKVEGKC